MKDLIKIAVILALAFASTFIIIKSTGLITEEGVSAFLQQAKSINPWWLAALVVGLLLIDLLIAVPTMTTILFAGFLMGPIYGGLASATGLMLLGVTGYGMGYRIGRPVLMRLFKDEKRLPEIETAFARNDLLLLFVCQAMPILPELSCTLAGIARTRFPRFLFGYAVGVVPFAFIVAYAGSISTLSNPSPAIYTAIGVSVILLLFWTLLKRRSG
ncbi:TVP38/TMEM64 family protein [Sphingorhabdus sp.]|jgi:uncharacterized membrane protein YdjX (TVP38/TMEM64 family)|uniref:TVP38/TMEM64 family protein n=1 Tax=Sphingorhabdus sp. TaxID=1902408 RepID=UPI0040482E65